MKLADGSWTEPGCLEDRNADGGGETTSECGEDGVCHACCFDGGGNVVNADDVGAGKDGRGVGGDGGVEPLGSRWERVDGGVVEAGDGVGPGEESFT